MKAKILSFLFILGLGLFMANTAFAANETSVSIDVAYSYTLTPGNGVWTGSPTYAWSISPSTGWKANGGADGAGLTTGASQSIVWTTATTYTITVVATDGNGCKSEPITRVVTVNTEKYCVSNQTGLTTCSVIAAGSGNTSSPDITTFDVTISNPKTSGTYTVNYTVGGIAGSGTISSVVAGTLKVGTITISHSAAAFVAKFENNTNLPVDVPIAITSVTNNSSGAVTSDCGTNVTPYNVSVQPKPVATFN